MKYITSGPLQYVTKQDINIANNVSSLFIVCVVLMSTTISGILGVKNVMYAWWLGLFSNYQGVVVSALPACLHATVQLR